MTTATIKTHSLRVERDRRQIERAALRKLLPVAGKALRHASHAVRIGTDPAQATSDVLLGNGRLGLPGMVPTLTRAMVMADLYGRRRTVLDGDRYRPDLSLSQADDERERQRKRDRELAALLLLLGLGGDDLASLYVSYRTPATAAARRIASAASEAAGAAVALPRPAASLTRHPRLGTAVLRRSTADSPVGRIRRMSEGFESGGLTATNGYALEREVGKAVVQRYEAGRFVGTPAVTETLWGYHYSAVLDGRTTELCRALDGTTAAKGDSFWQTFAPPNHWNALAEGTLIRTERGDRPIETIQAGDKVLTHAGRFRSVYAVMRKPAGLPTIRRINTASGRALLVTDEHPVLTSRGWKAARNLQVGDVLFQDGEQGGGVQEALLPNPEHFPSPFDEPPVAYEIVSRSFAVPVILPVNLKINTLFEKGEVHRVGADDVLEREPDTTLLQKIDGDGLKLAWLAAHSCELPLAGDFIDARHMHRVAFSHSFGRVGAALAPTPMIFAGVFGDERRVPPRDPHLVGFGSHGDAESFAGIAKSCLSNAKTSLDRTERFATGPMTFGNEGSDVAGVNELRGSAHAWNSDPIVTIADVESSKNVWNIAVFEDETYLANGLIVHNCRSCVLPVWESSGLRPPAVIQPYATTADVARFLQIKRQFLSYQ